MTRIFFVWASILLLAAPALAELEKQPVTIDDYGVLSYVSSPRIAPDGSRLTYELDGSLFVANFDGSDTRQLSLEESSDWNVTWSADSKTIHFLSDRTGTTQLFRQRVDSDSPAEQLSNFAETSASGNLSPDRRHVAFTVSDNALERANGETDDGPIVVTARYFRVDNEHGYIVDGDEEHIYVHNLATGEDRRLTAERFGEGQASWSPDGERMVFVSKRGVAEDEPYRTELWAASTAAGDEPQAPTRLTDSDFGKSRPVYSPDGEWLAFRQAKIGPYGLPHLAVMPADGGDVRILTAELDRWVNNFQWSADSKWIYFTFPDAGSVNLSRVNVADGSIEALVIGDHVVGSFDVADNGDIALIYAGPNDTGSLATFSDGELKNLLSPNKEFLESRNLAQKQKVRIQSDDDMEIDVFITTPADFDGSKPYPAILRMHGGPQDQFAWGYTFVSQYFAARGYVVIEPNPRGSIGRGEAFLAANYRAWGVDDVGDVLAAVDYAIDAGFADPDKLAATGFSYGGILTNAVITTTTRFKAAAAGGAEAHPEASFGHNIYTRWYEWELGMPWENRELYDALAPFTRVGNVETPTLYLGGALDWNQPIHNAQMMYQALRMRGIDTQLVVYPQTHHGGWSEEDDKDYYIRVVDWFDRYIKPEE